MLTADAMESINFEQLVTPTDRVLLRARHAKGRLSTNKIVYRPSFRVELAERLHVEPAAPAVCEQTVFMRGRRFEPTSTTSAAILASLFCIALILLVMLPM